MSISKDYLNTVLRRLNYYKELGDKTFTQLNEWDFHYRPNDESNSIAMIIQHMAGNMLSRWTNFLTEDGEKEGRKRDEEFEVRQYSKQQLIELWEKGWACFLHTLDSLKKKDLKKTVYIRQEPLTVIDAINRQLAHYPYHIGQIIFLAKIIKNKSWQNLSIPRGGSQVYNDTAEVKDPAKKY
ncbi:MAG: DUF1572 family protein [Sphingobacteriales bacterium]|nr:DUF1572 family protein [Sphingobacteriales bacterium]